MDQEFDDFDDEMYDSQEEGQSTEQVEEPSDSYIDEPESTEENQNEEGDFITELLRTRGIEDSTKIKFQNDEGEIEEVDWNSLSNEDKLNILQSSEEVTDLDDDEIELINAIRTAQLSPAEYLQHLQRISVENYLQNSQQRQYVVDNYTDDELYVMDLMSKTDTISENEALEALERAKSNEGLFKKQIEAMRAAYKQAEESQLQNAQMQREQEAQAQWTQFAEQIQDSISNFKEYAGYPIDMDNDDTYDLYTFITGHDKAGNSWFNKALQDPDTVVQMAWFVLNGEKMFDDINDQVHKRISEVKKTSYQKGLEDANKKNRSNVTYKPKGKVSQSFDDLDEEF